MGYKKEVFESYRGLKCRFSCSAGLKLEGLAVAKNLERGLLVVDSTQSLRGRLREHKEGAINLDCDVLHAGNKAQMEGHV